LNRLADMGQTFARWMQLFPNIARVIGYAAMALLGFAAVGAVAMMRSETPDENRINAVLRQLTQESRILDAGVYDEQGDLITRAG
ncbi:AhpA/YtjB family protein, partial [Salmonella enterica subsp. enterica serovar Montevideo]|nr:AhpA/YtjB family protein [Salmonella enterica subsp. enterica serovar Montevideo]